MPHREVFFACQRAFQAAPVNLDGEARLDGSKAFRGCELGACGFEVGDEGDHLGRDFVAAFRSALPRQQTAKPDRGNCALGLVEGRPGDAERGGGIADGNAVGLVAPYHLVAHLEQVPRVKEGVCREQGIANGFGMWVQHPVTRQRLALRVLSLRLGHDRLPSRSVNKNMPQLMVCQGPADTVF